MEKTMWLVLGATVLVAALRAERSSRSRVVARVALGVLFTVFGALVNAVYLVTDPDSFTAFGEMSQFAFVRETWASLVVPNLGFWIGLPDHPSDPGPERAGAPAAEVFDVVADEQRELRRKAGRIFRWRTQRAHAAARRLHR